MNLNPLKSRLLRSKALHKSLLATVGMVLFMAWAGGFLEKKVQAGKLAFEGGTALPAGAATLTVQREALAPRIDVVGTTASENKVHLSARLPAAVSGVAASAGQAVTNGAVLVTLDDRELREQLDMATAGLRQAESEYQRTRQLFEKNAATEQALVAAESLFQSAQANVNRMKVLLTYTVVQSPLDGIVTDRRIEAGDLAAPGQVLLSVYDPLHMRIEVPVPVRLVGKLAPGQEVDVELDAPARPLKGRVTEIVSEIDPGSRTRLVKVRLEGAAGDAILPGTFGRIWVPADAHDAILVPRAAVYRSGQLELVHVVRAGRVVRRLVRTGAAVGERVEVLSGLEAGDTILLNPAKEG